MRTGVFFLFCAACATAGTNMSAGTNATGGDLLVAGRIHTLDPAQPEAEAALVRGGKFVCVGARAACAAKAARDAKVLDLGEGSATPGLVDAHGHVLGYGLALEEVSCFGAESEAECVARVVERAKSAPPGRWIVGRGWDQNRWPGKQFPTEEALSKAVPGRPVWLERVDGHAAWLDAAALQAAGVTRDTPDPPGGRILRYADGRPSGVLVDNAEGLAAKALPRPDAAETARLLEKALASLAQLGLTAVHDAGVSEEELAVYVELAREGKLPIRVYAMMDGQVKDDLALVRHMKAWHDRGDVGLLTVRAVKMYADGALGSRGALMLEPYSDDPKNSGLPVTPPGALRQRIQLVAAAGFQPCVHAIGDRAVREVLQDYAALPNAAQLRPRVEHLQIIQPSDLPLLAKAHAVASMQPTHATSDGPWAEERLGHGTPRQKGAYAWRSVLDAGAPLACGSDFPIESPDPRAGLYSAVTRSWPGGPAGGWMPEQRLTREEALRCFTTGAAFASFAESRRGMVKEGMDADLTVFGADVLAVPAHALPHVPVEHLVVAGRLVF